MSVGIVPTDDDGLLADFYHRHWLDMGLPADAVAPDWRAQALAFIADARRSRAFAGFLAVEDGRPVDGACCQIVDRTFPAFRTVDPPRVGYVWGVWVEPASRGRGTGAALVRACLAHLAAAGCGRALLHAGERARPLYDRLGFAPTDELAIALPVRG